MTKPRPKNFTRRSSERLQPVDPSPAVAPRRRAGPAPWRSLVHHRGGSSYQSKLVLFFQNRGRLVSGNPGHLSRCLYWLDYLSDLRLRPAFPRRTRPATRFVPACVRSFDATVGPFQRLKVNVPVFADAFWLPPCPHRPISPKSYARSESE